jgi:pimeloyl-ACP methyl ester carboxylesterase
MERTVEVPGGRLSALDEGDGPAVLLFHAGIVDSRAWDALVPRLTAAGFRTIRFDRRGFGRSITDDVEFSNRADAVAVLDSAGVERACLVGNSQGGQVALDTALEFPDRANGLVMIGASVGGFEPQPTPDEAALFDEMERLEEAGDDVEAMLRMDERVWIDGPTAAPGRVPGAVRDVALAMDRQIVAGPQAFGRPIPLQPPAAERLDTITVPVLAVSGEHDFSEFWATAQHLEATVPTARAVLMPGVAHLIAMEAPDRLAALIVEFLRRPDASQT